MLIFHMSISAIFRSWLFLLKWLWTLHLCSNLIELLVCCSYWTRLFFVYCWILCDLFCIFCDFVCIFWIVLNHRCFRHFSSLTLSNSDSMAAMNSKFTPYIAVITINIVAKFLTHRANRSGARGESVRTSTNLVVLFKKFWKIHNKSQTPQTCSVVRNKQR